VTNSVDSSGIVGTKTGPELVTEIQDQIGNCSDELDLTRTKYIGSIFFTGTAEDIIADHAGKMIDMSHADPNVLSIPDNSAIPIPVNTRIDVCQSGAGLTTIDCPGSDTLNGPGTSRGQNFGLSLWKKSTTVWHVFGGE
jgi:hypothetical protein